MMIWEMEVASGSWCKLLVPAYTFQPSKIFSRVLQEPREPPGHVCHTQMLRLGAPACRREDGRHDHCREPPIFAQGSKTILYLQKAILKWPLCTL